MAVFEAPASELLVPYRNQNDVFAPLGFTVPLNWALLLVTDVAAPVVTAGAPAGVVKEAMAPLLVPALLEACI